MLAALVRTDREGTDRAGELNLQPGDDGTKDSNHVEGTNMRLPAGQG